MGEFTLQNRRNFIRNLGLGTLGVTTLSSFNWAKTMKLLGNKDLVSLTILHTNDMHSRIESFPSDHKNYPGQGGILAMGKMVGEVREEVGELLLLDAGDIFQGTPYFNEFGGELEFKMMSQLRYDCATMGNHDFDNGLEGFERMLKYAEFPFVTSNYDFGNTILNGKTLPYKIIEKKGLKIGVFGVGVAFDGLVNKKNYGETQYLDPIKIANEKALFLKNEEKCNLVICLSHLGYEYKNTKVCDKDLAQQTENINLIIGGHTHTFLPKAETYSNKSGKKVLVNQAGWSALSLGRVDFVFSKNSGEIVDNEYAEVYSKNYANFS
ncbi:MAG: metallophosphatase [Flavobacteriales bacterium]|nr:metallophosphatase [Flavobacteriales bacterium]